MKKKIKFEFSIIFLLLLISFLARLVAVLLYGDTRIDNEWGVLLDNLYNHKTYAFYEFENKLIPSSYISANSYLKSSACSRLILVIYNMLISLGGLCSNAVS